MKNGTIAFYFGIIALIAGIIATAMGFTGAFPVGLILFALGGMARLFENEVVDCLYLTFIGVAGLVFVLNFGETHFGSHEPATHEAHESAASEN